MVIHRRKNAAFTLVELLVVISILGVLMALLLPAVNSVRESMRRAQCKNNLHQIGVAAEAHLSKYEHFPSAGWGMMWLGDADRGTGASQPGGWIYQLLPFMGLDMIHDIGKGLGQGMPGDAKYNAGPGMKSAVIPNIICPTRRKIIIYPDAISQGAFNSAPASGGLNKTDYAGNVGSLPDPGDAFDGPSSSCLTAYPHCSWDANASTMNGVMGQAMVVTAASITNGLGNTFFAGEKSLSPGDTITVGGQSGKLGGYYNSEDPGDDNSALQGFDHDTIRWCTATLPITRDTVGVSSTTNSFGAAHTAGCHFVFCDGRVQLISYQIDTTVFTALGTRNYLSTYPSYTFDESKF
jgi:prepilin-type N-terminal cleavage/methylation domain-containing protein